LRLRRDVDKRALVEFLKAERAFGSDPPMTPQGNFLVIAPVLPGREDASRQLLGSMNARPGVVDAQNTLVPFGQFDRLHFARLLILTDPTARDIAAYGVTVPDLPPTLVFFGDCDGSGDAFLREVADRATPGLPG